MDINTVSVGQQFQQLGRTIKTSGQRLADALETRRARLEEADRASQYMKGVIAISDAYGKYNRELSGRKWDGPTTDPDGKPIQITLGQLNEDALMADHEQQFERMQSYIETSITNKTAQEQLLGVLGQKKVSNYNQVYDLWRTVHIHELIAQSDNDIEMILSSNLGYQEKMKQVQRQLTIDVQTGLRYADDAAVYKSKINEKIHASYAMEGALNAAKAANWNIAISDRWIDQNTPFWAGNPDKREAMKRTVRTEAEHQRTLALRITEMENDRRTAVWEKAIIQSADSLPGLQTLYQKIKIADFKLDTSSQLRLTKEIESRIAFLSKEPKDKDPLDAYYKENYKNLIGAVTRAAADGVQAGEILELIKTSAVVRDNNGNFVSYWIYPQDFNTLFGEWDDPERYPDFQQAASVLQGVIKDSNVTATEAAQAEGEFYEWYKANPGKAPEEYREAANTFMQPIKERSIRDAIRNTGKWWDWSGGERTLSPEEQAIIDVESNMFRRNPKQSEEYLNRLTNTMLDFATKKFPNTFTDTSWAVTDLDGEYGYSGMPLLYDDAGKVYRFTMKNDDGTWRKEARLLLWMEIRPGRWGWKDVTAGAAQPTATTREF